MRIDIRTFLAVLVLATWLRPMTSASPSNRSTSLLYPSSARLPQSLHRRSTRRVIPRQPQEGLDLIEEEESEFHEQDFRSGYRFGDRLGIKQMQKMLMLEGAKECCPSVQEMTTPEAGINREGAHVWLYNETKQTFYEQTCGEGVEGKPCLFLDRRMHEQSRCVQKRSFSYALITNMPHPHRHHHHPHHSSSSSSSPQNHNVQSWSLDYIQINSGCVCEVQPKNKKKKTEKLKKPKHKKFESD